MNKNNQKIFIAILFFIVFYVFSFADLSYATNNSSNKTLTFIKPHFNTTNSYQNESVLFNVSINSTNPITQTFFTGIYPTGQISNRTLNYFNGYYIYLWQDTHSTGIYQISNIYAEAENISKHEKYENLVFEIISNSTNNSAENTTDLCLNITCHPVCNGTTRLTDGLCINGTCQYTQIYNSTKCGYKEETIIKKAMDIILSSLSIIKGELLTITTRLSYENTTPIANEEINFYQDSIYLGSNITDLNGTTLFSFNTSNSAVGNHTINATYSGIYASSLIKIISSKNNTNNTQQNKTNLTIEESDAMQGQATVGNPVKWTKTINVKNNKNSSDNISINLTLDSQSSEIEIKDKKQEKQIILNSKKQTNKIMATNSIKKQNYENYEFNDILKSGEEKKYELTYTTFAPTKSEDAAVKKDNKWKKKIIVSSNYHYTNVLSYTDIEEADISQIHLLWKIDGSFVDITYDPEINIQYEDTNNNGKIDKIYWTLPHLSEQEFKVVVDLVILNIQSYPTVGGNWTVMFNTTGTADLVISAVNGTTFGSGLPDDLKFLNLKCMGEKEEMDSLKRYLIFIDSESKAHTYYELYATRDEIVSRIAELNDSINRLKSE